MRREFLAGIAIAGGLLLGIGCAARVGVGYRAYDPYYRDYHVWVDPEPTYYHQWTVETHRPNRDYRRLRRGEQREYWTWRHAHHPDRH
jgi:hypothetical protein